MSFVAGISHKFSTNKYFRHYHVNGKRERYNAVAMDKSGCFNIPKLELCRKLAELQKNQVKNVSLVPFSTFSKVMLFFDVDEVANFSFAEVEKIMMDHSSEYFDQNVCKAVILKNRAREKYHVIFLR